MKFFMLTQSIMKIIKKKLKMALYKTKQALYDSCAKSEAGITIIAVSVFSEDDGEFLGYIKEYV